MEVHQITADGDTTTEEAAARVRDAPTLYEPGEFTCNAYLAIGERSTLIDAGQLDGVVDAIREHAVDLDSVVLTHQHGDHVGSLAAVLDAFDPDLYCHGPHPRRTAPIEDGDELAIGGEPFEAIHTPGHAADHLAFVGDSALFSGDVVVYNDGAFEDGSFGRAPPGPARERLIESLETLLDRVDDSIEHLYAGHGDVFHGEVRGVIESALERAERREPKYG